MIIRKNDPFINENGEMIRINARHFSSDYAVSVFLFNEESEEYDIFDRDTFYTAAEVRKLAGANEITWKDDSEE